VTLVRGWREFTIPIDRMECLFNKGGDSALDLKHVAAIVILGGDRGRTKSIAIDDLRLLK
jgi:hypothetical protein